MISYSRIGHFGRLGNQLFQFASTLGIGRKKGYEVFFPEENTKTPSVEDFRDGVRRAVTFDIPKYFHIDHLLKPKGELQLQYQIQEPAFQFIPQLFEIPDGTDLLGYYQTEKYFIDCRTELLDLLTFRPHIRFEAEQQLPNTGTERISIHLRVGDYAGLSDFHPVMTADYYASALKWFPTDTTPYTFVIFSDDINKAREIFGVGENVIYIEGNNEAVDLCMMSMCEHNIIANSSFSWWGGWLNPNPNKTVVAPKGWFGPAYRGKDTSDLCANGWKTA